MIDYPSSREVFKNLKNQERLAGDTIAEISSAKTENDLNANPQLLQVKSFIELNPEFLEMKLKGVKLAEYFDTENYLKRQFGTPALGDLNYLTVVKTYREKLTELRKEEI